MRTLLSDTRVVIFEGDQMKVQGAVNDFMHSAHAGDCEFVSVAHTMAIFATGMVWHSVALTFKDRR